MQRPDEPAWSPLSRSLLPLPNLATVKLANDARWIARNDFGRRDVMGHDAACADDAAVADGYARKNDRAASDPHIVSDADRASIFQTGSPYVRLKWMGRGVDLHGRSHLEIVPDLDRRAVKKYAVELMKAFVRADVVAVITQNGLMIVPSPTEPRS